MHVNLDTVTVVHNEKRQRFEATVAGLLSLITYRKTPVRIIYIHTEVPPALEGNGIAGKLTQTALGFARSNHLRVVPQCLFVFQFIQHHPEYQDLLTPEDLHWVLSQK